jgi:hypothetical protein
LNPTSSTGGSLNIVGDTITNTVFFHTNSGIGPPTFTNRSSGTKLILYPSISSSLSDYAIGMDTGVLWFSVQNSSSHFKWYSGVSEIMGLTGDGNLTITGTVDGRDISSDGGNLDNLYTTIGLSALTSGEVDQLENIASTTISPTQWGYLGATDQGLSINSSVAFHSALIDSTTTTSFLVRKESGGATVFNVNTTDSQVEFGDNLFFNQLNSGNPMIICFMIEQVIT